MAPKIAAYPFCNECGAEENHTSQRQCVEVLTKDIKKRMELVEDNLRTIRDNVVLIDLMLKGVFK